MPGTAHIALAGEWLTITPLTFGVHPDAPRYAHKRILFYKRGAVAWVASRHPPQHWS